MESAGWLETYQVPVEGERDKEDFMHGWYTEAIEARAQSSKGVVITWGYYFEIMNTQTGDHPIQVDNGSDIAGQVALVKWLMQYTTIGNVSKHLRMTNLLQVGQLGDQEDADPTLISQYQSLSEPPEHTTTMKLLLQD